MGDVQNNQFGNELPNKQFIKWQILQSYIYKVTELKKDDGCELKGLKGRPALWEERLEEGWEYLVKGDL